MKRYITLALLFALLPSTLPCAKAAPTLPCRMSYVGNSYSGRERWVAQDVAGMAVLPDGTVFTNVPWEEGGANVEEIRNGQVIRRAGHTHGWGYEGGEAVAANARYLFIAQTVNNEGGGLKGSSWPEKGFGWSGVSRRMRSDISQPAPFADGRGKEGDVLQGAFLPVLTLPDGAAGAIRGAAASETELFLACPFDNTVRVFDTETIRPLRAWTVAGVDRICREPSGSLWALIRPAGRGNWSARRYRPDGRALPQSIRFPAGVAPTAMACDARGRLLVADDGPGQQILVYTGLAAKPKRTEAIGARGGILAPPAGAAGSLHFNGIQGIGADTAGNLYVSSNGCVAGGSTVLESYTPAGKLRWRLLGLTFVDLADADPARPGEVFTKEEHFTVDTRKPAGSDVTYRAYTVDRFRYPDDPRLHTNPTNAWVRRLGGKRFLFVTDMSTDYLSVYRFAPATRGEIAIPCACFAKRHMQAAGGWPAHQPGRGEWMWLDANGDGAMQAAEFHTNGGRDSAGILYPDERGDIWQVNGREIRTLPCLGLTASGVPRWDYANARSWPCPPDLDEVRRARYIRATDTMILGGNRGADRNQHWKPMGPVLCVYDHWSSGRPTLRQSVVLPYEKGSAGHESVEPISFEVAGDYLFAAYTRGLAAEGLKWAFVKVVRLRDLSVVGNLTSEPVTGEIGLLDLPESLTARKLPNGHYQLFLEDDAKAKVVMLEWGGE